MIEFASINDKKELSSLWQMIFLEDCQVIEYFFEHACEWDLQRAESEK